MFSDISAPLFFAIGKFASTVYMLTTIVGWIGNGLIVAVTIRSKSLHNPCNIIIATQAFSDILIQASHVFFIYSAYNEVLVTFRTCWKINFVFVSAMDFSTLLMFFIALDRLVAAKRPQFYQNIHPKLYIGGIITICLAYCTAFKFITYISLTDDLTMCLIAQSVTGLMEQVWLGCGALVNFGVVGIYYSLTKVLKDSNSVDYKRLNRSLNTMIIVYIFGWLLTMAGAAIVLLISPNQRVFTAMEMPLGIFANVNLAAPFFIYYFRSTLYRTEFRKLFGIGKNSVQSTTQGTSTT